MTTNVYGWVKLYLHEGADHEESVWAESAGTRDGRPVFRLKNIPFLRLSPTWGDVVYAEPNPNKSGELVVDGVAEKGGRWVAVYNYFLDEGAAPSDVVSRLVDAGKKNDLVVEPCLEPREGVAGCVYVAVPAHLMAKDVDEIFEGASAPADLERVIPLEIRSVKSTKARPPPREKPAKKKANKKEAKGKGKVRKKEGAKKKEKAKKKKKKAKVATKRRAR